MSLMSLSRLTTFKIFLVHPDVSVVAVAQRYAAIILGLHIRQQHSVSMGAKSGELSAVRGRTGDGTISVFLGVNRTQRDA